MDEPQLSYIGFSIFYFFWEPHMEINQYFLNFKNLDSSIIIFTTKVIPIINQFAWLFFRNNH
jgi:hypothetical protein